MGTVPYENLFVYEVAGEIFGSRDFFKKDFIGCWNEGEAFFLFFSTPRDEEVQASGHRISFEKRIPIRETMDHPVRSLCKGRCRDREGIEPESLSDL